MHPADTQKQKIKVRIYIHQTKIHRIKKMGTGRTSALAFCPLSRSAKVSWENPHSWEPQSTTLTPGTIHHTHTQNNTIGLKWLSYWLGTLAFFPLSGSFHSRATVSAAHEEPIVRAGSFLLKCQRLNGLHSANLHGFAFTYPPPPPAPPSHRQNSLGKKKKKTERANQQQTT